MKKQSYLSFIKPSNKNTMSKLVSGFTLIEIVIVISIMGLFTVMMYSSFDSSKAKSRDQKRVSDISTIQLALEQYFNKNGVYPTNLSALVPGFISEIPKDPKGVMYSGYFPITRTNGSVNCTSYQLWTEMEQVNQYLDTKKGFNSENLSGYTNYFECGNSHPRVDASNTANPLVYDVMP